MTSSDTVIAGLWKKLLKILHKFTKRPMAGFVLEGLFFKDASLYKPKAAVGMYRRVAVDGLAREEMAETMAKRIYRTVSGVIAAAIAVIVAPVHKPLFFLGDKFEIHRDLMPSAGDEDQKVVFGHPLWKNQGQTSATTTATLAFTLPYIFGLFADTRYPIGPDLHPVGGKANCEY